jgi:hypothetical protein
MDFDMFDLFVADHRRLSELIVEDGLAPVVIREISMHLAAESRLLYPAIERHLQGGDEVATRLLHGDHELEARLATVESDGSGPNSADEVQGMLQRHIDGQEQVFPTVKAAIPPEEQARLGQEVSRTIREAPTHPHPHLPDHGFLEPAADAIASTIDHLRDAGHRSEQ